MRRFAVVFAVLAIAASARAQLAEPADFVRSLYVQYADQEPTRQMIAFWVERLRTGTAPGEVQANVLGSSQVFDRVGRSNEEWLKLMYGELLRRAPDRDGMKHWQNRLRELRDDRVKTAREFLVSAAAELQASGPGGQPQIKPEDLSGLLQTTSQLLCDSVRKEYAGPSTFTMVAQAKGFHNHIDVYHRDLAIPIRDAGRFREQLKNVDASLRVMESTMAQLGVRAPSSRQHAVQCRAIVNELARAGGVDLNVELPALGGGLSREDVRRFRDAFEKLEREATRAGATLGAVLPQTWATKPLHRMVEQFESDVDRLRDELRSGYPKRTLAERTAELMRSGQAITKEMDRLRPDPRASQAWLAACDAFVPIGEALGLNGGNPLPGQQPGDDFVTIPRGTVQAIDRASAEIEDLIASYSPYAYHNVWVPKMLTDLNDLRNRYKALRTWTALPRRSQLGQQLEGLDTRFDTLTGNHRNAAADRRLANAPDLDDAASAQRSVMRLLAKLASDR